MRHSILCFGAVVSVGLVAGFAFAQEPSKIEIARQAKLASAFVEVDGTFKQGSAFCIHESGYFVTNQHVVGAAADVKLVLNPGLKDKKVVAARVLRSDRDLDLALLKVVDKAKYTVLPLGSVEGLTELTEVIAVGFPFGKALAVENGGYPEVSLNLGRVTSLRSRKGELDRIQIDAGVNPGNSGGPVLDSRGKVVGIVVSGVRGSTVNFAIPVSHLKLFVASPEVEIVAPSVAYVDRHKPAEFLVRATTLVPSKDILEVVLRISGTGQVHEHKMKFADGAYRTVAPLRHVGSGERVSLSFEIGKIEGIVADRTITIGSEKIKLSAVRTLRFGPEPSAILADARKIKGPIGGLDDLGIALGNTVVKVDAGKAVDMTVAPPTDDSHVEFTVIVRRDKEEVARIQKTLAFKNAPGITGVDPGAEAGKLEGVWILEKAEENGAFYPIRGEEALLFEGKQILWVNKSGKSAPGLPKAEYTFDPAAKPMTMDIKVNNGTWHAIYKIEATRLTIGTNANDEKRPSEFTTRLVAGPERSTFLRTYRRQGKTE